jgi:LysM repeat protein
MTLGSQMARTDRMSGSWGGSSRHRRLPPAAVWVLAAGGAVLLAYVVWTLTGPASAGAADNGGTIAGVTPPSNTPAAPTSSTPPGPGAPLPSADKPAPKPKPVSPPAPAPSVEMGSGRSNDPRSSSVDIPRLPTSIPASTANGARSGNPTLIPTGAKTGDLAGAGEAKPPAGTDGPSHKPAPPSNPPAATNPPANTPTNTPANTPAASPGPSTPPPAPAATPPGDLQARFSAAERAMKDNKLVDARQLLNNALLDARTSDADREGIRKWMAQINDTLVFSPAIVTNDPLVSTYAVASGDSLVKIANRQGVATDWRFIQRVNKMASPNKMSVGQKLKLVRGPFHAVVHKSAFRMDIFAGDPTPQSASGQAAPKAATGGVGGVEGVDPGWIYIRSFPVGLGSQGSTPTGSFIVRPHSKLTNPSWANPRTGEKFAKDDPKNPIGEYWLGLEGIDDSTRALSAYGVHGTIDPSSIGREMSMGCVRLGDTDIPIVYEMLTEGVSVVRIVP